MADLGKLSVYYRWTHNSPNWVKYTKGGAVLTAGDKLKNFVSRTPSATLKIAIGTVHKGEHPSDSAKRLVDMTQQAVPSLDFASILPDVVYFPAHQQ